MHNVSPPARSALRRTYIYIYPFLLVLAWILAWLLEKYLTPTFHWNTSAETIYWIAMKFLLWLAPVSLAIRYIERENIASFLALSQRRRGVLAGMGAGPLLLLPYLARKHNLWTSTHLDFGLVFVNAVLVAPIVEETVFRGFFLEKLLRNGWSFWRANSLFFLAPHLVGWDFQGRLNTQIWGTIAFILVFGLGMGWLKHRTESLYSTMVAHMLNNLFSVIF